MAKVKGTNNGMQNTTQKTKEWASRTPLKKSKKKVKLPDMPLACRAATKVLHFCLFLAIFSTVSQVLFMIFISPSTVSLHVFFGMPRLSFHSGVHCSAVLVMEFLSFLTTCPIHFQRLLNNIVVIFSCLHCLSRSSFDILFGQKMRRILLKLLVWKTDRFVRSFSVILKKQWDH